MTITNNRASRTVDNMALAVLRSLTNENVVVKFTSTGRVISGRLFIGHDGYVIKLGVKYIDIDVSDIDSISPLV